MPWLVREGEVLASLEVAASFTTRLRGVIGRSELDGAVLLRGARSVHTFGVRFPIDVAFCDRDLAVVETMTIRPNRVCRPRWRARAVLEAEAGAFERWRLRAGDQLDVKG